jgi:hypothetical protein
MNTEKEYGRSLSLGLKRLLDIDWNEQGDPEHYEQLVAEYLRRVAKMANDLQLSLTSPLFKPTSVIAIDGSHSAMAMGEFIELSGNEERLKNAYVRRSCECFLEWNEGVDAGEKVAVAYPDIFDPLIALIERGGKFGLHHGELLIGKCAIPLSNWKRFAQIKPM